MRLFPDILNGIINAVKAPADKEEPNLEKPFALSEWNNPYDKPFYDGMGKIEAAWSVIYNFKSYDSEAANALEDMCFDNIEDWRGKIEYEKANGYPYESVKHVPGYVRLAMLYERRKEWDKAIEICVDAIKDGAIHDGNKSTMYGRLARYISKSGLEVDEEILRLAEGNKNGN